MREGTNDGEDDRPGEGDSIKDVDRDPVEAIALVVKESPDAMVCMVEPGAVEGLYTVQW